MQLFSTQPAALVTSSVFAPWSAYITMFAVLATGQADCAALLLVHFLCYDCWIRWCLDI